MERENTHLSLDSSPFGNPASLSEQSPYSPDQPEKQRNQRRYQLVELQRFGGRRVIGRVSEDVESEAGVKNQDETRDHKREIYESELVSNHKSSYFFHSSVHRALSPKSVRHANTFFRSGS